MKLKYSVFCSMIFLLVILPCFSDTIIMEKNKLAPVIITKETYDYVYYQYILDGKIMPEQKIEVRKVVRIEYEKIPIEYQTAESFMEMKSYAKAIESYQRCVAAKDWTQQHSLYKIGVCYQQLNKPVEAIRAYQNLLKVFPDTLYKAEVSWELGQAYLKLNKWAEAATMFDSAKQLYSKKIPVSSRFQESQYYQAVAVEKSGKYDAAVSLYKAMLPKISDNKNLEYQIQLSLVNCYNQLKQTNQSRQILDNLIKKIEPEQRDILANLYINYARFHFAEKKIQEALLCYLRIIMLYSEVPEITLEAYQGAIYCMELLKKDNPEYAARISQLKQMQQKLRK